MDLEMTSTAHLHEHADEQAHAEASSSPLASPRASTSASRSALPVDRDEPGAGAAMARTAEEDSHNHDTDDDDAPPQTLDGGASGEQQEDREHDVGDQGYHPESGQAARRRSSTSSQGQQHRPEEVAEPHPESEEDGTSAGIGNHVAQEGDAAADNADPATRVASLEAELDRVTQERDGLESQYRSLLGKLTNMRNTLGDKLRQDADELDRREQQIANLQASNEDLQDTIETLKSELIASHGECERLHDQVESLRLRADDSARAIVDEASAREAALREVTEDLERCRLEREEWENEAMRERVERETIETSLNALQRELNQAKTDKEQLRLERDREAQSAANLHVVLEEFQTAKDKELKATLGDIQVQLQATSKSLVDYRQRAQAAEAKLAETQTESERAASLQKEVKEKNLLIGKLRHEAVILNEHLIEALRRLKKESGENNVDRRLVTNVLISFFNTPRADSKRFEMLSLLASILGWSDEDRERAGLQRLGTSASSSGSGAQPSSSRPNISMGSSRRRAMSRATSAFAKRPQAGDESFVPDGEMGMEQSFSNLWVEYLLREAQAGSPPANDAGPSLTSGILPSLSSSATSPPLPNAPPRQSGSPTISQNSINNKAISPFAELARPASPTKSSGSTTVSSAPGTIRNPPSSSSTSSTGISRTRSDTGNSEAHSIFSQKGGDASSTAPTSIASGYK